MNRFATLHARERKWLTAYLTLGDPQALQDQAAIYVECGVDVLEVGVPHPDPFMDGPLVAESMQRAMREGVSHAVARSKLASLRGAFQRASIVLMGYEDLAHVIQDESGNRLADGILQIGVPAAHSVAPEIARIGFVSQEMPDGEIERARHSDGYVMLQANEGKTGIRESLPPDNERKLDRLRSSGVQLPILLGFGVSTARHAASAVMFGADGVVIGSACLQAAEAGEGVLRSFLREVRAALDDPQHFLR
jgi:tryptophan synthase alpha chain